MSEAPDLYFVRIAEVHCDLEDILAEAVEMGVEHGPNPNGHVFPARRVLVGVDLSVHDQITLPNRRRLGDAEAEKI